MIKMLMVTAILHHDIMVQHILDAKFQIVFFSFYYYFNLIILLVLFFLFCFFLKLRCSFGFTKEQTGTKALYVN